MTHDFKGEHDRLKNTKFTKDALGEHCHFIMSGEQRDVYMKALRLAVRLQSGEISDAAVWEGMILQKHKSGCPSPRDVFKAMAAQLMKEVEDE